MSLAVGNSSTARWQGPSIRLAIISAMPHYRAASGEIRGWGPTVDEIDVLAGLFSEVVHVTVVHPDPPPAMAQPYASENLVVMPLRATGGSGLLEKLGIVAAIPSYLRAMRAALRRADIVHVRAPANVSLIALCLLALRRSPRVRWAKYAGNWKPTGGEPWSYRVQRLMLRKGLLRGMVTVNGTWPGEPPHIIEFMNPSIRKDELDSVGPDRSSKSLMTPIEILYVGRLDESKGIGRALEVAHLLASRTIAFRLHVLGDGPARKQLEATLRRLGLESSVTFHGWVSRPNLNHFYGRAHFLLLPSASEGWPKVASEAMTYGAVPLLGAISSIPHMVERLGSGVALEPTDVEGFAEKIQEFLADPVSWERQSAAGRKAARVFSYAAYEDAVRSMFFERWGIAL